ncbi:MAG: hypothetical protein FWD53_04085, partial [Phycisphaerales bacterium]|nr:hypothetical protein [Phycisphaerales bacterium]
CFERMADVLQDGVGRGGAEVDGCDLVDMLCVASEWDGWQDYDFRSFCVCFGGGVMCVSCCDGIVRSVRQMIVVSLLRPLGQNRDIRPQRLHLQKCRLMQNKTTCRMSHHKTPFDLESDQL